MDLIACDKIAILCIPMKPSSKKGCSLMLFFSFAQVVPCLKKTP